MEADRQTVLYISVSTGSLFKSLHALLKANFKGLITFFVANSKLFLEEALYKDEMQTEPIFLVDVCIERDQCTLWNVPGLGNDDIIPLSFNMADFGIVATGIYKKDTLTFLIYADDLEHLILVKRSPDRNTSTKAKLKLFEREMSRNVSPSYENIFPTVTSDKSSFNRSISSVKRRSKVKMKILAQANAVRVMSHGNNVAAVEEDFGDWNSREPVTYTAIVDSPRIGGLINMSSMSNTVSIYAVEGMPLRFYCKLGTIGYVNVYIQPCDPDKIKG